MKNQKRSPAFIRLKHSIESCTNIRQLKGIGNILQNIPDHNEFLALLAYYEAKEKELSLDVFEEEITTIHHKKFSP